MKKNHDGTDDEPLVGTLQEAAALWDKGINAIFVLDLGIPTGDEVSEIEQSDADRRKAYLSAKSENPDFDDELPF